jgi:hypothetical protein
MFCRIMNDVRTVLSVAIVEELAKIMFKLYRIIVKILCIVTF